MVCKPPDHLSQLQSLEQIHRFLRIEAAVILPQTCLLKRQCERCMPVNQRQSVGKLCHLPVILQGQPGFVGLDIIQMVIRVLNGVKFRDDLCRCLLTHTRNSRDVIRRITHQCLHIDKFRWCNEIPCFHILRIIILNFSSFFLRLRNPDHRRVRSQLQKIPVPGNDPHIESLLLHRQRYSADQIIRFEAFQRHQRDIHSPQDILHHRDLLPQLLGHRASRPLVGIVHLMAERRSMEIEGDSEILRLFFIKYSKHDIQKAQDRIRMQSFTV